MRLQTWKYLTNDFPEPVPSVGDTLNGGIVTEVRQWSDTLFSIYYEG